MKMKITAFGIAVMTLCASLAVMPASASDFTLDIFGNANMDDIIDELDIEYVQEIIDGSNDETELSDANYDGKVDENDIAQIELIIRGNEKELTIIDFAGRTVTIDKPVEKIVLLNPNPYELCRALGAEDKIVGIHSSVRDNYQELLFPELKDITVVGTSDEPNYETIIDLDPDLLIQFSDWPVLPDELQEILGPAGINVLGLDFVKVDVFYNELAILGYILDTEERTYEYIDFFQSWTTRIDEVVEELDPEEKRTVYYEEESKYHTTSYGVGDDIMVRAAGGIHIYDDVREGKFFEVDPEDLVERNPDVIFKSGGWGMRGFNLTDTSEYEEIREEVMNRPELSVVNAVKNGDVYVINWGITGGWKKIFGTVFIAKYLYPEKFEDLEPHDFLKEHLKEWQNVPYRGVFVYPYPPE